MEYCPTCKAKYNGNPVCHRCKTDLSLLLRVESDAKMHLEKARRAFDEGDFEDMFFHARRSCSLRRLPGAKEMLTLAAILTRRYERLFENSQTAITLVRYIENNEEH